MSLPQTTLEQRAGHYEDLETLLEIGFLSHPVILDGTPLCLRTLSPGDMFALQARMSDPKADWRIWAVSTSVWMLNGVNLLGQAGAVPRLAKLLQRLPGRTLELLFTILVGLFKRHQKAIFGVEAYCYEASSRYLWHSFGGHVPTSHSGVSGAEYLGTNPIQRMWIAFNTVEDQRELAEANWEGFKLAAGAQAPKGVKKLDEKDRQRREREDARRQSVRDQFYYWTLGLVDEKGLRPGSEEGVPGAQILAPKTTEDLEEEMRRWVAGEDDWHDQQVKAYKNYVTVRHQAEKADQKKRQEAYQAQMTQGDLDLPTTQLMGLTPDQMEMMIQQRNLTPGGVRQVDFTPPAQDSLYDKYLDEAPVPGKLAARGDRLVETDGLSADVARRLVPFSSGQEAEQEKSD